MFTCHLTPAAIRTATPLQPHRAITACFFISFVTVVHYQRARLLFNKALKALLHLQWSQFPFAVLQHVYIKGLRGKNTGSPLCHSSQSRQAGSDALSPKLQRAGLLKKKCAYSTHILQNTPIYLSLFLFRIRMRVSIQILIFIWLVMEQYCSRFPKLCLTVVLPFSGIPTAPQCTSSKGACIFGRCTVGWKGAGLLWLIRGKLFPRAQRLLLAWEGEMERNQCRDP